MLATQNTGVASLADGRRICYSLSFPSNRISASIPDQPIVLLSNSLSTSFLSWDHLVPKLNNQGFSVLGYDQRGHGLSSTPRDLSGTTFSLLATDVKDLLDHLGINQLFSWIGISMGAATGVYFASHYPGVVRYLVICGTISCSRLHAGVQDVFTPRIATARQEGSMESIIEQTLARWFSEPWRERNPREVARMREVMRGTSIDGFETCTQALVSPSFDLRPLAPKLGKCVESALLVVGESDADLPETLESLRASIESGFGDAGNPNVPVRLKVLRNSGHMCYVDALDEFAKVIGGYLQGVKGQRNGKL